MMCLFLAFLGAVLLIVAFLAFAGLIVKLMCFADKKGLGKFMDRVVDDC